MNKNKEIRLTVSRARYNLLFFILLSVINVYFLFLEKPAYIPYCSAIATYSIPISIAAGIETAGYIISAFVLITLFCCFLLSKKSPFFLFISFSIVIADTIALLVLMFVDNAIGILTIFNVILHLLTAFYIFVAIKVTKIFDNRANESNNVDLDDTEEYEDIEVEDYVDDGTEPLLKGNTNGLYVFAVIHNAKAELVINQVVCDAIDITHKNEFELSAVVDEVEIYFQYRRAYDGTSAYLYAGDALLDSIVSE